MQRHSLGNALATSLRMPRAPTHGVRTSTRVGSYTHICRHAPPTRDASGGMGGHGGWSARCAFTVRRDPGRADAGAGCAGGGGTRKHHVRVRARTGVHRTAHDTRAAAGAHVARVREQPPGAGETPLHLWVSPGWRRTRVRCAMGRCRARKGGPLQQAGACAQPPADQAGGERFGTWVRHAGNETLETEVCDV